MKICHLTSAHKSSDIRIFEKECVSLAKKRENQVFLIAKGKSFKRKNVNIIGIGLEDIGRIKRMLKVTKKIYKTALKVDADIYHIHDPELLLYALKLKRRGKKVIFDSHEYYSSQILHKEYIPGILRIIISKLYKFYETHVVKNIDGVIFPCKIDGRHPFQGIGKEIEYIDNVPLLEEVKAKKGKKIEDFKEKALLCTVGGLTYNRGIKHIIEAALDADVKIILAGNFSPEAFKKEIMELPAYRSVDYRGYCNREEVNKIYDEATIGVSNILNLGQYPQIENLPTKVYEYMMNGMPFIISNFKYAKEVADKYKCGIAVEPANISELSNAIKRLRVDAKLAFSMGENGRKAVLEKFNWGIEEEKLYKFYDKILSNKI